MSSFSLNRENQQKLGDQSPAEDTTSETSLRADRAYKRESRLTFGGLIYVGVTVFLAIGAVNSQNNLLFWLFGVSIATLIVSGIFSGNALMKTRLRARALKEVYAGQRVHLHYTVNNRSRFFPLFACLITEAADNAERIGTFRPASLIHTAPGGIGTHFGTLIPTQRGRVTLREIRLTTRFPFGLLQKTLLFNQPRPLLALPYPLKIKSGLVLPKSSHGEQVRRRTNRGGNSNEFWGLREYRPGDPRKQIAWKQSARRGGLVVVENAQTISSRVWIWIGEPDVADPKAHILRERGIALAAALLEQGALRTMPIGLWYPERGIRHEPASGRAHIGRALRSLATVDTKHEPLQSIHPPLLARDQIIYVSDRDSAPKTVAPVRVLDTNAPDGWLNDPQSLPASLGGNN